MAAANDSSGHGGGRSRTKDGRSQDRPGLGVGDPWARPVAEVLELLGVRPEQGLSFEEAQSRRHRFGPNQLAEKAPRSAWAILVDQFKSVVTGLLVVAGGLSYAFGETAEGTAIAVVVVITVTIGLVTELRAARSMEALARLGTVEATVRREGQSHRVPAAELVPGDIVVLAAGQILAADLRLVKAAGLECDESALTGESVPVAKATAAVGAGVPLAERTCMAYSGTAVTRGGGLGVVTATGQATALGDIASLVAEATPESAPLERRLDEMGRRLVWITLGIAAVVAAVGVATGRPLLLMIETGIALAVATIPEGLPVVATAALARGMWRMARRSALINRLPAVETLGATSVICTDKTGTLTENQMTVTRVLVANAELTVTGGALDNEGGLLMGSEHVDPSGLPVLREIIEAGVLCNDASVRRVGDSGELKPFGDPLEVALLVLGEKAGIRRRDLLSAWPEVRTEPFTSETKRMATIHGRPGQYYVAAKGAPEALLEVCTMLSGKDGRVHLTDSVRERWLRRSEELGEDGLRVLALATGAVESPEADPFAELTFLGLVAMLDPPREEVRGALDSCRAAGIRVVMVTGDQAATATRVAAGLGIAASEDLIVLQGDELRPVEALGDDERERLARAQVFARVEPKQKLHLIALHQAQGSVVAMTGDGINDAPALRKADIGIAMGQRGTDVARQASDMILLDDAFASIVFAIEQGRVIFRNIRRFVLYLLSCNIAEVAVVTLAFLVGLPLPVLPLQILFLNLVTDVFPALALGVGEGNSNTMREPPRPSGEPILRRSDWAATAGYGALISACVLGALLLALHALGVERQQAVTISFLTLALAQLWHVFNMRDRSSSPLANDIVRSPLIWGALALCVGLVLVALYVPQIAGVMHLAPPSSAGWALVAAMSLLPLIVGQLIMLAMPASPAQGRRT